MEIGNEALLARLVSLNGPLWKPFPHGIFHQRRNRDVKLSMKDEYSVFKCFFGFKDKTK